MEPPLPARPAATVVVVRPGPRPDSPIEVLMARRAVTPVADRGEVDRVWWGRAAELLAETEPGDGSITFMWPTLKMLQAVQGCHSVQDVLALRVKQVAPPRTYPHPARPP